MGRERQLKPDEEHEQVLSEGHDGHAKTGRDEQDVKSTRRRLLYSSPGYGRHDRGWNMSTEAALASKGWKKISSKYD